MWSRNAPRGCLFGSERAKITLSRHARTAADQSAVVSPSPPLYPLTPRTRTRPAHDQREPWAGRTSCSSGPALCRTRTADVGGVRVPGGTGRTPGAPGFAGSAGAGTSSRPIKGGRVPAHGPAEAPGHPAPRERAKAAAPAGTGTAVPRAPGAAPATPSPVGRVSRGARDEVEGGSPRRAAVQRGDAPHAPPAPAAAFSVTPRRPRGGTGAAAPPTSGCPRPSPRAVAGGCLGARASTSGWHHDAPPDEPMPLDSTTWSARASPRTTLSSSGSRWSWGSGTLGHLLARRGSRRRRRTRRAECMHDYRRRGRPGLPPRVAAVWRCVDERRRERIA